MHCSSVGPSGFTRESSTMYHRLCTAGPCTVQEAVADLHFTCVICFPFTVAVHCSCDRNILRHVDAMHTRMSLLRETEPSTVASGSEPTTNDYLGSGWIMIITTSTFPLRRQQSPASDGSLNWGFLLLKGKS